MKHRKQERRLRRLGRQLGYDGVEVTAKGHLQFRHAGTGVLVVVGRKMNGVRAERNIEAELRRHARAENISQVDRIVTR